MLPRIGRGARAAAGVVEAGILRHEEVILEGKVLLLKSSCALGWQGEAFIFAIEHRNTRSVGESGRGLLNNNSI